MHFTGSTAVFNAHVEDRSARNMASYRSYPRIVGETGGKDFIVAHPSADPQALAVALIRGAFEYQGQKCSAASRIYVPRSLWHDVRDRIVADDRRDQDGRPRDFRNFMGAVIDKTAFDKHRLVHRRREEERQDPRRRRRDDSSKGYFVEPTLVADRRTPATSSSARRSSARWSPPTSTTTTSGRRRSSCVDSTSPYALTGAIFAHDREGRAAGRGRAARTPPGNFYINDKPTGAVVGQQPFGGARASGTNDKAGSKMNLMRWVSARTVKETFSPPRDYQLPVHGRGVVDRAGHSEEPCR